MGLSLLMATLLLDGHADMRILLTGASGIIGKSLIRMLSKYADYIDATFYSNLFECKSSNCQINIIPYNDIFRNNINLKYDQIWHFATYGQPARFIDSWPDVIRLNVYDTQKINRTFRSFRTFFLCIYKWNVWKYFFHRIINSCFKP